MNVIIGIYTYEFGFIDYTKDSNFWKSPGHSPAQQVAVMHQAQKHLVISDGREAHCC